MLQLTLDESEAFSAWTTAKDAGYNERPPESRSKITFYIQNCINYFS